MKTTTADRIRYALFLTFLLFCAILALSYAVMIVTHFPYLVIILLLAYILFNRD